MTREMASAGQDGSAAGAGLEAGLVGLLIGFGFPLLMWAAGLASDWSFTTVLCSIALWPAIGVLAAFWLRERGGMTRGRLTAAGAVAGALTGLAGSSAFIAFQLVLDPITSGLLLSGGHSTARVVAASACIFGLPSILVAAGLGAGGSVVTGSILGTETSVPSQEQAPPVGRLQQLNRTQPNPGEAPAGTKGEEQDESYLNWAAKLVRRRFMTLLLISGGIMIVIFICSALNQLLG